MKLHFTENDCLWRCLQAAKEPVFLYGTGNGADKILDVCNQYQIPVGGIFASDGFVRRRTFRNMPVQSLSEIEAQHGCGLPVLLCFGTTLPDVTKAIRAVATRHRLFIPEVPLFGGSLFDWDYFCAHRDALESVGELFSDEESRLLYQEMIAFRLTGRGEYLRRTEDPAVSAAALLGHISNPVLLDGGAYRGDSAQLLASVLHPKKIVAVEPDPKTYAKLSSYATAEQTCTVVPIHAALSDTEGSVTFCASASRASGRTGQGQEKGRRQKEISVPCTTVDRLAETEPFDIVKLDVEGEEAAALRGADKLLARRMPALAVSLYHRTEDLFTLPAWISQRYPGYRFYLRRVPCIPAWDLILYAVR